MDKKTIIAIAVIATVLLGTVAFALSNPTDNERNVSTNNGAAASEQTVIPESDQDVAVNGDVATITFTDEGFTPAEITVKKGTKITVINNADRDVQFSSDEHPSHRDNPEMNLRTLGTGESDSYTANTVGTHMFHDHIDESQVGTVIVTE